MLGLAAGPTNDALPGPVTVTGLGASRGTGEDVVGTVTFQGQHRRGAELAAGVASASQSAEPLLADGEDDGHRQWSPGRSASARATVAATVISLSTIGPYSQPSRCLMPASWPRRRRHRRERGRRAGTRRIERPLQVADIIDGTAFGRLSRRRRSDSMGTRRGRCRCAVGQRHGIRGDRRRVERHWSAYQFD